MQFKGFLYRALNPNYASAPLSGEGAKLYGGRFNPKGIEALYSSLSPETAIRESNQVGSLQPTMLVCYEANIQNVFDTNDSTLLKKYSLSTEQLAANNWRDEMNASGRSATQIFAQLLIDDGYNGLRVRSHAAGSTDLDQDLVVWCWENDATATLQVIDDESRLTIPQAVSKSV